MEHEGGEREGENLTSKWNKQEEMATMRDEGNVEEGAYTITRELARVLSYACNIMNCISSQRLERSQASEKAYTKETERNVPIS